MSEYILSLDQGTTSSRAIIFDKNGISVSVAQKEFRQIFPEPGWVEHDPSEIWETQYSAAQQAMDKVSVRAEMIAAAGIANQRETTLVWNRKTGKPVYNAIVWQDRRTAKYCDDLKERGMEDSLRAKTGLVIDAYFSATKLKWILDNVKGARKSAEAGELAFGTVDAWLAWNLTDGHLHITDVTNASRTMLFNIHTLEWDDELLKLFDIPPSLLPEVKSSSELYGNITVKKLENIPLAGIAGDQQAALFGQMCIEPGMVKNTYGTGCFMIMNTGNKPIKSESKLLTTIGWKIGEKTTYALEGSIFIAGAVVQWLRDGLGIIKNSSDIEMLATSAGNNGGVFFVPAFTGLGAPYWNQHARGTLVGLTRGTNASQIARASLESIAFQTFDVLRAMETDSGISIKQLRVDGGATVNNFLMQFQSDIMSTEVIRPVITETTALGAAYLAGLAVKYWSSAEQLSKQWKADKLFSPTLDDKTRNGLLEGWSRAVRATEFWAGN